MYLGVKKKRGTLQRLGLTATPKDDLQGTLQRPGVDRHPQGQPEHRKLHRNVTPYVDVAKQLEDMLV